MSSKLIFLLLTALLLVQCSVGKPMPDADTAVEVSREEETKKEDKGEDSSRSEGESEETPLASFLLGEFTELTDLMLTSGKKLIEDVVTDVSVREEKSDAITIKVNKLKEFANNLDKIDLKDKKKLGRNLSLLGELNNLLVTFNSTAIEKPNAEDLIIEASLKKQGIEKMVDDVKVKFLEFTERFYVAADKYWDSLTPEEQTAQKMFAEWLQVFKDETNIEKKIDLFGHIFEINEQSE